MTHCGSDEFYMRQAIDLASATVGLVSPKPCVGCIIVRDNIVISSGVQQLESHDDAVSVALKIAAARSLKTTDVTAYVSLGPCIESLSLPSHVSSLQRAGVRRVVIATRHPILGATEKFATALCAAGIEVKVGVLEALARELNEPFACFTKNQRPLVVLKAGLSADGKLAPDPKTRKPGQTHWITGDAVRVEVHRLRHSCDAILTGIGSILADDPLLTDRSALPRHRPLLRVVLDTHLRVPVTARVVVKARNDLLIFCGRSASRQTAAMLTAVGAQIEYVPDAAGRLDLAAILSRLAQREILNVLLEGGFALNGSFIEQNLVDKVILFYAPSVLGHSAIPFSAHISSPFDLERKLNCLTRVDFEHNGLTDVRVMGYLRNPWELS
jgi:diaminohydroxyphosphoribosylaminopyrimidine deaminase / 5-amino-6-(5-phosphoribosylamino)uracil reductase